MTEKSKTPFWRIVIKGLWTSRLSVLGIGITTISAGMIVTAIISELLGASFGSYQGLITYMLLPGIFVFGLTLIPFGTYVSRHAAKKRGEDPDSLKPFVVDLSNPKHLRFWGFVFIMTVFNVTLLSMITYNGYHYTESTEFCGTLCHSVMEPEYVAYQRSPHARVACVDCHIGSGASWFAKAKLSGLRQVWAVAVDDFSKPIPTPIHNLRPSRETCEQCHWPEVFHGNRPKVFRHIPLEGDATDPEVTALMLHVGGHEKKTGRYSGIHWHVSNKNIVEFRSVDGKREEIRDVRVTKPDGSKVNYVKASLPEIPESQEWRTMGCVDCHNRPTHIYEDPGEAVDKQILNGFIDATLPNIKKISFEAISKEYPDKKSAEKGIMSTIQNFYRNGHPEIFDRKRLDIIKAADILFHEVYAKNVYPRLNIKWNTYPSHIGHRKDMGCFRCHDEEHETPSGESISQDCDQCHTIIAEEERESELDSNIKEYLY